MTGLTPRLSEVARHLVIPDGIVTSVFPRVERRLGDAGVEFDRWQQGFGTVALGCRKDGKYAATVGGVVASIPRQVGKTFTVGHILIGLALEFPGLKTAWTSHHNRTTTNTFRSMQGMVRSKGIYPLLDHTTRSDGIRSANGEQEIRFKNGSLMMFGAREQGFGRGIDALDVEVFDEAQILTLKALEDMVPATNQARHEHGALVFFIGTPPRPSDPGEAFTAKREQALSGKSKNLFYVEFSADPDSKPDDVSQYSVMNPSYPHRTPPEAMERMRANIPDDDSWDREARGIWPAVSVHQAVVSAQRWNELVGRGPDDGVAPVSLGVDMSHGRDLSVAACWVIDDLVHVEQVWAGSDLVGALEWIVERAGRRVPVVVDSVSPASALVPELKARRVRVRVTSAADMARACGMFVDRVEQSALSHDGGEAVSKALAGARKRPIRDAGGWAWDRRDPTCVIHPLVAVSLSLLGAAENPRARRGSGARSGGAVFA